jgi:hypothetical protein
MWSAGDGRAARGGADRGSVRRICPVEVGLVADQRTADDVAVSCDRLGDAVEDDVGAEPERLLESGSGEGVVDQDPRPASVCPVADRLCDWQKAPFSPKP